MLRQAASRFAQVARQAPAATRGFAAKAADDAMVAPPLKQYGIAGRYSAALYSAASKNGSLPKVEAELASLGQLASSNPTFAGFLADPSLGKTKKAKAVMALVGDMGMCETTKSFMGVLASNGRLKETEQVAKLFNELMMASKGQVFAVVTSADPLSQAELDDVTAACKSSLEAGKTLNLEQKVDPSIIGGLVIDIGDKHIDLSINTKIRKMEALLAESI